MNIKMRKPDELVPYGKNTKKHSEEQIKNVAASIKSFGFVQPVVVDKNNTIVIGHSRVLASKMLGMDEIPVVTVDSLSDDEVRALRIADNKLNESSWDAEMLGMELGEIEWGNFNLDFDFTGDTKRQKAWEHLVKKCNLKKQIRLSDSGSYIYTTLFNITKDGIPIDEIKQDRSNVKLFADAAVWYIKKSLGHLGESWCLMTTPRRRNKNFHFATAVCEVMADEIGIPFYRDAVTAVNRHRVNAVFQKNANPIEENIILYDDIITTGETIKATIAMFSDEHAIVPIISIRNKGKPT